MTKEKVVDHKGNVYENNKEMANAYGISRATLEYRLNNEWDLRLALETPVGTTEGIMDHEGNNFGTIKEMAEHWGKSYGTLRNRLNAGWTLPRALLTPVKANSK